jgi:hypothetical protein
MILSKQEIYQWEKGVYITFSDDEIINQVHFSHLKYGKSTDVDVVGGRCEIPVSLLRTSGTLYAWGVVKGDDSLLTEFVEEINIIQRARPSDYVYTPEEMKQWSDLQKQIGDLELLNTEQKENLVSAINEVLKIGGANSETIKNIVDEYLQENPPKIEEKDPYSVKSVNGKKPDENGNVEIKVGGSADIPRIETSENVITIKPNKFYVFPEMTSLDVTLGGEVDSSIVQEYKFRFTSGVTATTLTLSEDIKGDITVDTNSVVEISIIDGYAISQSWAVNE